MTIEFDYKANGYNWLKIYPDCALSNQSPINFMRSNRIVYYRSFPIEVDNLVSIYSDLTDVPVEWSPMYHNIVITLSKA